MRNTQIQLRSVFIGAGLVALCVACAAPQSVDPSPTAEPATPTAPPTATSAPTAPPSPTAEPTVAPTPTEALPILLEDDFSDPDSGWEHYQESDGVLDYEEGEYRIWVNTPSNVFWVNARLDLTDVVVEADATMTDGPEDNWYGLMCRLERGTYYYYAFLISSQGDYGIGKVVNQTIEWIGAEGPAHSEAINPGAEGNRVRASCIGETLTLSVNGEQLLQVQNADIPQGDVGMVVATLEEPGVDVLFDNFVVMTP